MINRITRTQQYCSSVVHTVVSLESSRSVWHTAAVRRLQWQPLLTKEERTLLLASCSVDHAVRILSVVV